SPGPMGVEDARFAPADVPAPGEHDDDEIDAVAVRPLRRGPPDPAGRVDPELMGLDIPARDGPDPGEQAAEADERGHPGATALDLGLDGLEPAFEAAVQRVVVDR